MCGLLSQLYIMTRIDGVIVNVLALISVDRGLERIKLKTMILVFATSPNRIQVNVSRCDDMSPRELLVP